MNTFEYEISFLSKEFNQEINDWQTVEKTKKIQFRELNQNDKSQHKLHFMLISLFENKEGEANISTDKLYDITVKFIQNNIVLSDDFKEIDKEEFLNDSAALFTFGFWLLTEKITPFFSIFKMK